MRSGLDGSKTGPVRSGPDRSAVSGPRDRKKIEIKKPRVCIRSSIRLGLVKARSGKN